MKKAITLLTVISSCLYAEPALTASTMLSDSFDALPNPHWRGVPSKAQVQNGVLVIRGNDGACRMSSLDKFRYGKYTVRFRLRGIARANYVYFGFMSREPWGRHGCMVILDGGRFRLQVRHDGGKVAEPFDTPIVAPDVWHTLTLDWKPTFVEMLWDGESRGRFEEAERIPDVFITAMIDVVQTGPPGLEVEIDSVEIEGGEIRRVDRSGFGAPRPPVRTPPDTKTLRWPKKTAPSLKIMKSGAVMENAFYRAELTWDNGLRLTRLDHRSAGLACLVGGAFTEIFTVVVNGGVLRSSDFRVTEARAAGNQDTPVLELRAIHEPSRLAVRLVFAADSSPEARMSLEVENQAAEERKVTIYWPYLSSLQIGDKAADNYYLFPWKGGWCHHHPIELAAVYGQSTGLLQLFTLFDPSKGAALYTYLKDESGRIKTAIMRKMDRSDIQVSRYTPLGPECRPEKNVLQHLIGTQFTFRCLPYTFAPGQRRALPDMVLAVSPGDWREAFSSYAHWAHTWMIRPEVPAWYQRIFQTIAVHDEAGNTGFEHGWRRNGQWALAEQARPGDGLLEVVYWWNHPRSDGVEPPRERGWYKHTIGQYDYWDEVGGLERLRQEIAGVHKKGVKVTLYTTPRFAWRFSDVRKAHPEWLIHNSDGNISRDWSAVVNGVHIRVDDMCYSQKGWQDFIAGVAGRVVRDTGCDGVFMDTMNEAKFCYNPRHNHPESPSFSAEAMLKKYRQAIKTANPQAIMSAEDVCAERFIQFMDGCLIKTFEGTQPNYTNYDLYCLHFVRFYFPEIKYAEWGSTFDDGARRALFNGVAYMRGELNGGKDPFTGKTATSEEQLAYLAMTSKIMSENADAFSSLHPKPLVPTLVSKVYANEFPGQGQTIWTLYNRTGRDIDEAVIEVEHVVGARYIDLVRGRELSVVMTGDRAALRLALGNGEVTAIAQRASSWRPGGSTKSALLK